MKLVANKPFAICAVLLALFAFHKPILAHHGTAGYEPGKTITLTGTVSKYDWSNPHVVVYVDVKDADGNNQ